MTGWIESRHSLAWNILVESVRRLFQLSAVGADFAQKASASTLIT